MASTRFESRQAGKPQEDNGASRPRRHDGGSRPSVPGTDDSGDSDVGLRDLIDFFKKTPPPPTNYMSIPDEPSSSEEDNWEKLKRKVFRHRKSRKRRPPVIVLPDSAVAARTRAGHRHIAISIPIEFSHLAPLPRSQYPVYDSIEAAFQREINSRFGMWKNPPAGDAAAGLDPVSEDHRESQASSSRRPTAVRSGAPGNAINRSASLSHQQRYTPRRAKGLAKTKSVGSAPVTSRYADAPPLPPRSEKPAATPTTGEAGSQDAPTGTLAEGAGAAASGNVSAQEKPTITLTVPSRSSSKLLKKPAGPPLESGDDNNQKPTAGSKDTSSHWEDYDTGNNSSGNSNGDHAKRISFAASILTTGSSIMPQVRQAQTARAYHSVPIIVRPPGCLPQALNPPAKADHSAQTSLEGLQVRSRSRSRERKVRDRKERDMSRLLARGKETGSGESSGEVEPAPGKKREGKGKEPAFATPPDMPSSSYSSSPPKSSESSQELASSHHRQKQTRTGRERFVSNTLAEEQATLEKLPREEVIRRYSLLRERSLYDREKRLRKLERCRDSWVRAVPMLLQDLNGLLREQHRLLEGAGLSRHHRRRAHSVDVPSRSVSSYRSLDPGTQRSRSLHSSNGSRPSYPSSKAYSEDERPE